MRFNISHLFALLVLLLFSGATWAQSSHASTGTINADCETNLTAANFAVGFQCWDSTENRLYIQESGTWSAQTAGGSDDLGNHTATQNLDLADFGIVDLDDITFTAGTATVDLNTIVAGDRMWIDATTTTTLNNGPAGFTEGLYAYMSNETTDGLQVLWEADTNAVWVRPIVASTPGSWDNIADASLTELTATIGSMANLETMAGGADILDASELDTEAEFEAKLFAVLTPSDTIDISDNTNLAAAGPITLTGDTVGHATSGVSADTYTGITVDTLGHVTGAVNAIPRLSGSQPTCSAGNDDFEGWYYDTDESPIALCGCVDGTRIVITGPNCDA